MSSGEGEKSTIYKTIDGGENWTLQYTDQRKEFFLDALVCLMERQCYALGDPMDGKFVVLATEDGERWERLPHRNMPAALSTEGAFAASNSSMAVSARGEIVFGTGGPKARVFRSVDRGRTWTVVETPIASGNASSGIFSIAGGTEKTLVIAGGDYKNPNNAERTAAYSVDGGVNWRLSTTFPPGYRSAALSPDAATFLASGPTGSDASRDGGLHWVPLNTIELNAMTMLNMPNTGEVWAVGPKGAIWSMKLTSPH